MRAHKVILSACSTFFRALLQCNPHQHPLIYLRGVRFADLQNIVDFMYHGEVNVAQDELNSFLEVAEDLKIKGLSQNLSASTGKRKDFSPSRTESPTYIPQNDTPSLKGGLTPNPPNKRSRRDLTNSTNNLNRNVWLFKHLLSNINFFKDFVVFCLLDGVSFQCPNFSSHIFNFQTGTVLYHNWGCTPI